MMPPAPPPFDPELDAIIGIEAYTDDILSGDRRFVWWDRSLWWRTQTPGGFDGYRTLTGRRLPCATLETAVRRTSWGGLSAELATEVRRLSR